MRFERVHYKYVARSRETVETPYRLKERTGVGNGVDFFVLLEPNGLLHIAPGYAWDGASGPAIDTKTFMRGSLVHDALYQLMREELLDATEGNRRIADDVMREVCLEDGMSRARAWWTWKAVRLWGTPHAKPRKPVIEEAP